MELQKLQGVMPSKWRVQSFSQYKPSAQCVSYIDARDVMDKLDEVVGPENWKDEYKEIAGNLFAGVSIKVDGEWVTKWDTGNESNIEKSKGEVSDSFKRAAVKWGVGRFLYSMPIKNVPANEKKTRDNRPYIVDSNGNRVWNLTEHLNGKTSVRGLVKALPSLTREDIKKATTKEELRTMYTSTTDEGLRAIITAKGKTLK